VIDDQAAPAGELVCPACRVPVCALEESLSCPGCGRSFPIVEGLPDLRLNSDRYLSLEEDRAKARRLADLAESCNALELAEAYYTMTADVDARRRALFLAHLARAEDRGAALAAIVPKVGRVLEVGCGSGGLVTAMAGAGASIVGVDIAMRWLVVARQRLADRRLQAPLVAASAEALPWPDKTFDTVVADSVIEHLDNPATALSECARVLRPGGRLVLWSPNRFSIFTDPHVGLWGVGWLPQGCARAYVRWRRGCDWPLRLLSARSARRIVAAAGFEQIQIEPPRLSMNLEHVRDLSKRILMRLYHRARCMPGMRDLVTRFGPLWQLTAIRKGAA
jgi:ubiquinone/menaquinone biosynthesis C-methylase UbiE/uncharacterized protein YbaR (Trm112 family)